VCARACGTRLLSVIPDVSRVSLPPSFDLVGKVVVDSSAPAAPGKGGRWWQVRTSPTCHHLQKHQGESRGDEEATTSFQGAGRNQLPGPPQKHQG
ncbi:MAG TPA: hypothetical protein VHD63_01645, partial [Ktedonobacteraceae bacterium]|nr:hypothetical protein [Ktedonobacteraceae bacterium]